jgi:protein-S-isoprenylcysteine O-methyltransferase Ste14
VAALALAFYVVYLALAFGLRAWLLWRRTGDHGFRLGALRGSGAERGGALLFVLALVLGLAALVAGIELQVRAVEEPHLLRTHGEAYARWARATGRFVPSLGKLSDPR